MPATRYSGYFAAMHLTIAGPSFDAHDPPGRGPGLGDGPGEGVAAGVRKVCVAAQPLVVSPSPARARQQCTVSAARSEFAVNVVCPGPSFDTPEATIFVNAWSVATWNSYDTAPTAMFRSELFTVRVARRDPARSPLTGETGP